MSIPLVLRCLFVPSSLAFAGLMVGNAFAAEDVESPQSLRLNGFGSLAGVSQSSNFGGKFRRDTSQAYQGDATAISRDSRIGLQANYAINDKIELVGQGVLKDRVVSNSAKDAIEWAFLSYSPTPEFKLRIGRTSADMFLLSDYRNVGFAYLTARPNVDFYGMLPFEGLDGADLTRSWESGDANWRAKVFAGNSQYRLSNSFGSANVGSMSKSLGLVLSREKDGLLMRGTLARSNLNFDLGDAAQMHQGLAAVAQLPVPAVAAQALDYKRQISYRNFQVVYGSLGVSYDRDNWVLNAEAMRTQSSALPQANLKAGYFVLGRRLSDVTVYGGASGMRILADAQGTPQWATELAPYASVLGADNIRNTQILGSTVATVINAARANQQTLTFGARWDVRPTVALKLQWDRTWAKPNASIMWSAAGGRADVVSAVLDFVF